MSNEIDTLIEEFTAPYNKTIKLENIEHESGMKMLRMHIREGRRFTIMDMDVATAQKMANHFQTWVKANE